MAKGNFTAERGQKTDKKDKKPKPKVIKVDVEGQVMTITRQDGEDPIVTGGTEDTQGQLDLKKLPDDTVIFTHTNPTCGYYYFNGKLWYK